MESFYNSGVGVDGHYQISQFDFQHGQPTFDLQDAFSPHLQGLHPVLDVIHDVPMPPKPYVTIIEQPKSHGFRFRYQCEGRSAGSILGESSSGEKKTYPTIKICNYQGPAIVIASCVTKDDPAKPHPHSLVGKDCKKGVCTLKISNSDSIVFPNLGIQCVKKREVTEALNARKDINVDPYQTGFGHVKDMNIDFSTVRLCFQVFIADEDGNLKNPLQPVTSQKIIDKKAQIDLSICRIDRSSGKSTGNDEVFLLCDKVVKDDIKVRFFEEDKDGNCTWESFGSFGHSDVHHQFAIVFQTPPYKDPYINKSVSVLLQLFRPSDQAYSKPREFLYQPQDPDPDRIAIKRKRKASTSKIESTSTAENPVLNSNEIKNLLRLKTVRKTEAAGCSFNDNIMKPEIPAPTPPCIFRNDNDITNQVETLHVPAPPPEDNYPNLLDDLPFFESYNLLDRDLQLLPSLLSQSSELGEMTTESLHQCLINCSNLPPES